MSVSDTLKYRMTAVSSVLIGAAFPVQPIGIALTQGMLGLGLVLLILITPFDREVRATYGRLRVDPIFYALVVMFAIWFVTTPWSNGPWDSFTTVLRTAAYIAGAALIWAHMRTHEFFQIQTLKILVVTTALMLTATCFSLLFSDEFLHLTTKYFDRHVSATLSFKAFASLLSCLTPVLIWAGYRLGGNWRLIAWGTMPAILYVIIATHSRSSIAGLLFVTVAVIATIVWKEKKLSKVSMVTLTLTVMAGLTWVWKLRQYTLSSDDSYLPEWLIDPHRQVIWRFTFEKFMESPWVGQGVNRINFVPGADLLKADIRGAQISSHPHNWPLEILSETGIFGLSAAIIVLGMLAVRLLKRYKASSNPTVLTLIALGAAFFGSSLFNFSIWSTWWQLTFFILFAIVSARQTNE